MAEPTLVAGLDVGGTKTLAVAVDVAALDVAVGAPWRRGPRRGRSPAPAAAPAGSAGCRRRVPGIVATVRRATGIGGREPLLASTAEALSALAAIAGVGVDDFAAVGLGVPGLVDRRTGTVRHAVNLGVDDEPVPLAAHLGELTGGAGRRRQRREHGRGGCGGGARVPSRPRLPERRHRPRRRPPARRAHPARRPRRGRRDRPPADRPPRPALRVRPARLPGGGGVGDGHRGPVARTEGAVTAASAAGRGRAGRRRGGGGPRRGGRPPGRGGGAAGPDRRPRGRGAGGRRGGRGARAARSGAGRAAAAGVRSPVLAALHLADRVALVPDGVPAGALGAQSVAAHRGRDRAGPMSRRSHSEPAATTHRGGRSGIGHVVSELRVRGGTVLAPGGPVRSDVFVAEGRIVSVRAVVGTTGQEHDGPDGRIENGTVGAGAERSVVDAPVQDDADPAAGARTPVAGGVPGGDRGRRRRRGAPRRDGPPGRARVHRPAVQRRGGGRPDVRARAVGRGGGRVPPVGGDVVAPDGGDRRSVGPGPGARRARRLRRPGGGGAARPAPRGPVPRPRAARRPRSSRTWSPPSVDLVAPRDGRRPGWRS